MNQPISELNGEKAAFEYNSDGQERDKIIGKSYRFNEPIGGTKPFKGLSLHKLQRLINKKFANPQDYHNDAPTIEHLADLGKLAKSEGHKVLFAGFAVDRKNDYRIDIDSISIYLDGRNVSQELKNKLSSFKKNADDFVFNDAFMSAWWD